MNIGIRAIDPGAIATNLLAHFLFVGLATLSPPQWLSQSPFMTVDDSFRNSESLDL
jgi:hypothetical protein